MPEDRISRLSQRFRTHATGRRPSTTRTRERQSLYLDIDLVKRIDKTHKALSHELYPARVGKSDVLEALLEYGLEHLAEIKAQLGQEPEADGAPSQ
jgi:hypothetical protein